MCLYVRTVEQLAGVEVGVFRFGGDTVMVMVFIKCTTVIEARPVSRETENGSSKEGG